MKTCSSTRFLALSFIATLIHGYSIPANLQTIYNQHKAGKCSNNLQGGFSPGAGSSDTSFCYCGDLANAIYIHSQRNGGQYADMDIDCDGGNRKAGKCADDPSGKDQTAFQDTVQGYNAGISDLDANLHPYVVFGNKGFKPQDHGIKPLSVMAVVCNNQLHYGVWGDTNGGNLVGEASIALADLCFPGENLNGNKGHDAFDVMYIAFAGSGAVPGKSGAKWNAADSKDFEVSIKALGDQLVSSLK